MIKELSICVPVFNKINFTRSCLNDLKQLDLNKHEILVLDNGSTDETQSELTKLDWITYIRSDINNGFAWGCNKSFQISSGKNILFLNNDIKVKSNYNNWTDEIINNCYKGLVGPTTAILDSKFNFIKESNENLMNLKNSYMSGWCIASSREIWYRLAIKPTEPEYLEIDYIDYKKDDHWQIFSEEFGKAYYEDVDLSFRAKKIGIQFELINIPVIHFGKISSKQLNTAKLYQEAKKIFTKKWS